MTRLVPLPQRQRRKIDLWSARVEAYLTTNAFPLLFLIGYAALVAIFFFWGFYQQFQAFIDEPKLKYFVAIARGAGYVLDITCALVILLASKLLLTVLRETPLQLVLPLDRAFPHFHVLVGYTILAAVVVHAVFHLIWIIAWDAWHFDGGPMFTMAIITGFILTAVLAVMLVFARRNFRREHFHRFYFIHVTGATIFFGLLFVHDIFFEGANTYKWILGPVLVYILDRAVRHFRVKSSEIELGNDSFILRGQGIINLRIPKQFGYHAGQYAEIMIPKINREWHPFTIASAPEEDEMHFFIKVGGDWTSALEDELKARLDNPDEDSEPPAVRIKGPYGAPAQHVRSYHRVVLVSGGVGSTPFSSICKHLHHLQASKKHSVEKSRADTTALHNVNRRVLEKLAEIYTVDVDELVDTVAAEEVGFRGQHVINMAEMLGCHNTSADSIDFSDDSHDALQKEIIGQMKEIRIPLEVHSQDGSESASTISTSNDGQLSYASAKAVMMPHVGSVFFDIAGPIPQRLENTMPSCAVKSVEQLHREKEQRRGLKDIVKSLYAKRAIVLAFAHTTRISFIILLSLLLRGSLLCVALIIGCLSVSRNSSVALSGWIITSDTVLGLMIALQTTTTILLEISYMGTAFFRSWGRMLDLFLMVPLIILTNAYGIRTWVTKGDVEAWYVRFHVFVFLPILSILLLYRLYRSVGSRALLKTVSTSSEDDAVIPAVDFMWTTPRPDDDEWLREELNPLQSGSELRLHRFVTRANGEDDLKAEEEYISTTRAGRPQWNELLRNIALETPSEKDIGVFFCGPKPMGSALRKSLMKIEVLSNLRSAYLNSTPRRVLISELGLYSTRTIELLRKTGCNIRFVYREENFGH